jgi:dephospho-CoA kinase
MIRAGITGTIGSGKTLVSSIFSCMGIQVFCADTEAKKCYNIPDVLEQLCIRFGYDILGDDGKPDFGRMAAVVFNDERQLQWLNELIHPVVMKKWDEFSGRHSGSPYVIMESAILFETGYNKALDFMIHVSAPAELCIRRVIDRDRTTEEKVKLRMKNQWEGIRKASMADFVIYNNDRQLVIPQVLTADTILRKYRIS